MTQEKRTKEKEHLEKQSRKVTHKARIEKTTAINNLTEYTLLINNEKIGRAVLGKDRENPNDVCLYHLDVKYEHQGYGGMLLAEVISDCNRLHKSIWGTIEPYFASYDDEEEGVSEEDIERLHSKESFERLLHLYERYGFEIVGNITYDEEGYSARIVRRYRENVKIKK
jgi:GNAT superfamily N-acetyltransferase